LGFIDFLSEAKSIIRKLLVFRSTSIAKANRANYDSLVRVEAYAGVVGLKKPEQAILDLLKAKAPFKRMLDIGVGAGRTTPYFAEIAEEYIGIDYSENMIKHCRRKFQKNPNVSFKVADSRKLSAFEENYFDFVLDSGALDSVEHEDRLRILHEIWRINRAGGYFCFATSNLAAMLQYCKAELSANPKILARTILKLLLIRCLNSEMWKHVRGKHSNLEHTMFITGADEWGLKTYCITPKAQINQLKNVGFNNIQMYDLQGKRITRLPITTNVALYFLCTAERRD
jgi:ubiquinone/menaquinone biosynthesis C-methylase UbiE